MKGLMKIKMLFLTLIAATEAHGQLRRRHAYTPYRPYEVPTRTVLMGSYVLATAQYIPGQYNVFANLFGGVALGLGCVNCIQECLAPEDD